MSASKALFTWTLAVGAWVALPKAGLQMPSSSEHLQWALESPLACLFQLLNKSQDTNRHSMILNLFHQTN